MILRRLVIVFVLLVSELTLGGCGKADASPPDVSQGIAQLAEQADALAQVTVEAGSLTALAVKDGELVRFNLTDGVVQGAAAGSALPARAFDEVDGQSVEAQVADMAGECDANYSIRVQFASPAATSTVMRCSSATGGELEGTDPVEAQLGGRAPIDYPADTVKASWSLVLDQLATLAPDHAVTRVSITEDTVTFVLPEQETVPGCRAGISVSADGRDVMVSCNPRFETETRFSLAHLTAADLERLQTEAMTKAGIKSDANVSITISEMVSAVAELSVRQGSKRAAVPLR